MLKSCDQNNKIIIIGDFNINWDDKHGRKNLKRSTDYFNLEQLIEKPTRITNNSQTRIDLLFSNKPNRIIKTFNFFTGLSDHKMILFSRKLSKKRHLKLNSALHSSDVKLNFIPKNQTQNLNTALKVVDWEEILRSNNIESSCNSFINKLKEVMSSFTCRGSGGAKKRNNLPWLNQTCKDLLKIRDVLLKQYLKSGLSTDREKFTHARK